MKVFYVCLISLWQSSNPQDFYIELENFQKEQTFNDVTNKENIVSLSDAQTRRTLADEFDGRF